MAKNPNEKIFFISYDNNSISVTNKLHEFIDVECDKVGPDGTCGKTAFHWARYIPNTYTLATTEKTQWDVQKLTNAIDKYLDKRLLFVIFDITDSPRQGRMNPKYWKFLKESENLTESFANAKRARKLKKIKEMTENKLRLKLKAEQLEQRKIEVEKKLKEKLEEDRLREEEKRIQELEDSLNTPDIDPSVKKKRKKFLGIF